MPFGEAKALIDACFVNGRKVRILPVHAWRSERSCFSNQPLMINAAKVLEEPKMTNAAAQTSGRFREQSNH